MDKNILLRFLKCEASPEEEERVLDWLDADPANRMEFDELDKVFCAAMLHAPLEGVEAGPPAETPRRSKSRRIARYAAQIAAVVALGAGVGIIVGNYKHNELAGRITSISAPNGQRINITLEDGTDVWLNAGTTLSYPVVFGKDSRRVSLSGEAYFDVSHEHGRPFFVETNSCEVEVLGTRFNIEADDDTFSLALFEGSVMVSNLTGHDEYATVRPDEVISLVDGRLVSGGNYNPDAYRWREGLIDVRDVPFRKLMAKFEKAYDVRIAIDRTVMPEIKYTSGKIRVSDGVEKAMQLLQYASDFEYEIDNESNTITIR